jgi:D-arginine utilization repressor
LSSPIVKPQPQELFRDAWQDRVNVFLKHWLQEKKLTLSMLKREHKRELVVALYAEGRSLAKVPRLMLLSCWGLAVQRFNHLKELRDEA